MQGMVDEAHVVLAMYCMKSGFSNNSVDNFGDVLKSMCQTDPASSKFQMGRIKLQYVVNHGLFPHFKQMILDEILKSSFMSVLYDKSLNESTQKSEMDIHVRYWNDLKTRSLCCTGHLYFLVILDMITLLQHFVLDQIIWRKQI